MSIDEKGLGLSSDAVCSAAREWMLQHYKDEAIVALRYYTDEEVPRVTPSLDADLDKRHVSHIRDCERCTAWVRSFAGEKWMERQRRLAECCCPRMFGILEAEKRKGRDSHMEFKKEWHHDAGWLWHQKFYYGEVSVFSYQVNYCPWCGRNIRLPDDA
jgi:hypothetical protein